MSETKKRNTHLPEFKARAGLEAVASSNSKCNFVNNWLGGRDVRASQWLELQVKVVKNDLHTPHPSRTVPD